MTLLFLHHEQIFPEKIDFREISDFFFGRAKFENAGCKLGISWLRRIKMFDNVSFLIIEANGWNSLNFLLNSLFDFTMLKTENFNKFTQLFQQ